MALDVRKDIPLAPLTTFRIGGDAKYFTDVRSESDIAEAIEWAHVRGVGFIVLGGGSNVLVPDSGLERLVIRLVGNLWSLSGEQVDAWAGSNLLALIKACAVRGLGGWEKLAGIPGSIGGAIRGNAGAFGTEIKDLATTVRALNTSTGEAREFRNVECDFSYRHSFFKERSEWIITRVQVRLAQAEPDTVRVLIEGTIAERERRHLQNVKAAGSYFMNPVAPEDVVAQFEKEKGVRSKGKRVPAGWLIEKAGMKGAVVGGAIASVQHPNYLVNKDSATAADVRALADKVRNAVKAKFGVELVEEAAVL